MFANCALVIATAWGTATVDCAAPQPDEKKPSAKTHTVHFEKVKWADVFDWYANVTAMKAEVVSLPKGTVSLKPEKDRKFTPAEITDLLNEQLVEKNLLLIPNRKTFAVVSREGKIDPKLIPSVEFADVPGLARTALVEVAIPVTIDPDDELASQVKKSLSPVGELVSAKAHRSSFARPPTTF